MILQHLQDLAFADRYSIDKIVGVYENSFQPNTAQTTTLGGYLYQYAIPHNYTRPVFTELVWSTDNSTFVDGGSGSAAGISQTIAYSDSANIYITTGASSGTIYYKLIASWIDNFDATNPLINPVLNTTQTRVFDSQANYQKIVLSGTLSALPAGPSSLDAIIDTRDLPPFPNGKLYIESLPGQVWPAIGGGAQDFFKYDSGHQWEGYMFIKQNTVEIVGQAGTLASSARFWYRIYGDSQ